MIHVDFSSFTLKTNLANLETEVNKIDIAKLTPVSDVLAKLSNAIKNDVVKETEYNKLVTKVDNIDSTGFVLKTKYDIDKSDLRKTLNDSEKMIPNTRDLTKKKTDLNAKIIEIENKIPIIPWLATNSALTAVKNKMPNVSNLVKGTNYKQKLKLKSN